MPKWRPGSLARNTILATFWQMVRLVLQFAYLIIVARTLGAESYGIFAGTVAMAASLSPFVGFGFSTILVQEVSRSPQRFPEFWAKALRATMISSPVMAGVMLALAPVLLPVDNNWTVIVLVAASELIAMPLIAAGSLTFQAHERLGRTIFNHVQLNIIRLGSVAILAILGGHGLIEFAWIYFGSTVAAAVLSLTQVGRSFGRPDWPAGGLAGHIRTGLGFSLSVVASTAHSEFDKTLLLRLNTALSAGNYSLTTRLVSAATTPLVAYILATVPRLFREGERGVRATMELARRLLPPIFLYGVAVAFVLFACAPYIPRIFGQGFKAVQELMPWLALLPLLSGISQLSLNVLTTSGQQRARVVIEITAVISNVALNIILIPLLGAEGAALSILCSQSLLALLPAAIVYQVVRRGAAVNADCHG